MDDEQIKKAVIAALDRSVDAHELSEVVRAIARGPRPTHPDGESVPALSPPTAGAQKLLTRIVLGDILDDSILGARPQDRTFPLRLFFGELGRLLASDEESDKTSAADGAFVLASGLNFFFRAAMSSESKMRVGLEVSRQLYGVAHAAQLDRDIVAKAAPLLATLMTNEVERLKFESVDHLKVFDSALTERTASSDPTSFNIVRPASFLCRVVANNSVKVKAEVVT